MFPILLVSLNIDKVWLDPGKVKVKLPLGEGPPVYPIKLQGTSKRKVFYSNIVYSGCSSYSPY